MPGSVGPMIPAAPDGLHLETTQTAGRVIDVLADSKAFSGFAVTDTARARDFYGETLGVRTSYTEDMGGMLTLHLGTGADVLVYGKQDHEPAGFTVLNFPVPDVEAAVDGLVERGIEMLRYDAFADAQDERGIMRAGGPLIAWFTDPFGNVLSVLQLD